MAQGYFILLQCSLLNSLESTASLKFAAVSALIELSHLVDKPHYNPLLNRGCF